MRIVIIGAVAAGTAAAAKARRNDEDAQIVVYERDGDISYSGCGMPYYLAGDLKDADALTPRDSAYFKSRYNVDVLTRHEALSIDPSSRSVRIRRMETGEEFTDTYDRLILATGARAVTPGIPGADGAHVFTLRAIADMRRIKAFLDARKPKTAALIGAGFIGLEMCESLTRLGIAVTIVEKAAQVAPGLDWDAAVYVQEHLKRHGVRVLTGVSASRIEADGVVLSDGRRADAEIVLLSVGVRPNTELAAAAGIRLGVGGAIAVDERMRTNLPDVYACGDCAEQFCAVTGRPVYRPLGSTAAKTGRIAGDSATGGRLAFKGVLGTGIFRIFDRTVAATGLTEREARELGFDAVVCHNIKPDRPEYMGGAEMVIKAVADRATGRLLGAQIVGSGGVDKRIDVFATAITFGATADDLSHLDLAYAPPYATTRDPVHYTGMILDNAIRGGRPLLTAQALDELMASGEPYALVDARAAAQYAAEHIKSARSVPHEAIRSELDSMDRETVTVTYCNKGVTGNAAQNILLGRGFQRVFNLSGGFKHYKAARAQGAEEEPS